MLEKRNYPSRNFFSVPKDLGRIIEYVLDKEEYRVADRETDFAAYTAWYLAVMLIHSELQDENGDINAYLLFNELENRCTREDMYPYLEKLLRCKWLFYIIVPRNGNEFFECRLQPVFDPMRISDKQYLKALWALKHDDYSMFAKTVPVRKKEENPTEVA